MTTSRTFRPQIASGAGSRFALAGAKCERRLPARYGPAPEVPDTQPARCAGRRVVRGRGAVREWRIHFRPDHAVRPDHTEGYR